MFVSCPTTPPGGQTSLFSFLSSLFFNFLVTKDIFVALPGAKTTTLEAS